MVVLVKYYSRALAQTGNKPVTVTRYLKENRTSLRGKFRVAEPQGQTT